MSEIVKQIGISQGEIFEYEKKGTTENYLRRTFSKMRRNSSANIHKPKLIIDKQAFLTQFVKAFNLFSKTKTSPETIWLNPKNEFGVLIEGDSLIHAMKENNTELFLKVLEKCSSVIVCRATPSQKAEVVNLIKDNFQSITLAIGDGGNDVSMIQVISTY